MRTAVRHLDLTDLPQAAGTIDEIADELDGIDVLVNNAGAMTAEPALEMDYDTWRRVINIDLKGAFLCSQRAAKRMIDAAGGGRIIMITSVHEHAPRVGAAPYCVAKAGQGALAKVLAAELTEYGITVNSVAPGEIATPINDQEDTDVRQRRRPDLP